MIGASSCRSDRVRPGNNISHNFIEHCGNSQQQPRIPCNLHRPPVAVPIAHGMPFSSFREPPRNTRIPLFWRCLHRAYNKRKQAVLVASIDSRRGAPLSKSKIVAAQDVGIDIPLLL